MKEIPLTQGKASVVDDEDYDELSIFKWFAHKQVKAPGTYYAERNIHTTPGKRKPLAMHIAIMNPPAGYQVDHRDGNGLNNQRYNLRVCVCSQNQANARKRVDCSSGAKGVSRKHGKWVARIQVNKKRVHLGFFPTVEQAAGAYKTAAKEYFGDFART